MRSLLSCLLFVATLGLALSSSVVASAQQDAPTAAQIRRAARAFDQGRQAFRDELYVEAAEHFEAADSYAPSAAALKLAITSRVEADQLARAATLAALAKTRDQDDQALQQLADEVLTSAKQELHEVKVYCDQPCELVVDNKLVHGPKTTERTVYLSPGQATLRASWSEGRTKSEPVSGTAGGVSEVQFIAPIAQAEEPTETLDDEPEDDFSDAAAPEDAGAAESGGWSPTVFYVGLGLTAVAGGVTIWSGIDTQNNPGPDAVTQECQGIRDPEECTPLQDGLARQNRTNALIGVTAGLGVTTLIIGAFLTDWGDGASETARLPHQGRKKRSEGGVSVRPWFSVGDGASIGAMGRF